MHHRQQTKRKPVATTRTFHTNPSYCPSAVLAAVRRGMCTKGLEKGRASHAGLSSCARCTISQWFIFQNKRRGHRSYNALGHINSELILAGRKPVATTRTFHTNPSYCPSAVLAAVRRGMCTKGREKAVRHTPISQTTLIARSPNGLFFKTKGEGTGLTMRPDILILN